MDATAPTDATERNSVNTLTPVDVKYCGLFILPEIIQRTALHLPFENIRRYYCVCKIWYRTLKNESFWKKFVVKNLNFQVVSESSKTNPLQMWLPGKVIGYWSRRRYGEHRVFKQMPQYHSCGVVTPPNFDIANVSVHFEALAQALWILKHMMHWAEKINAGVQSFGNENRGKVIPVLIPWEKPSIPKIEEVLDIFTIPQRLCNSIKFKLRRRIRVGSFCQTFDSYEKRYRGFFQQYHCEERAPAWTEEDDKICKKPDALASYILEGHELMVESSDSDDNGGVQTDEDVDEENDTDENNDEGDNDEEEEQEEEEEENPSTDGEFEDNDSMGNEDENESDFDIENPDDMDEDNDDVIEADIGDQDSNDGPYFAIAKPASKDDSEDVDYGDHVAEMERMKKWIGRIFQPSYECYAGEGKFNPVVYFHITSLGDGYVGGVMSNIVMT